MKVGQGRGKGRRRRELSRSTRPSPLRRLGRAARSTREPSKYATQRSSCRSVESPRVTAKPNRACSSRRAGAGKLIAGKFLRAVHEPSMLGAAAEKPASAAPMAVIASLPQECCLDARSRRFRARQAYPDDAAQTLGRDVDPVQLPRNARDAGLSRRIGMSSACVRR